MTDPIFDHDKLDVYRLAVEYVADSFAIARKLSGLHRHARDQWLRASHSIPLNIAEGNGKRSVKDRSRYFEIARGSAFECAAIQDVLVASGGLDSKRSREAKKKLKRIVSMLTQLTKKTDGMGDMPPWSDAEVDYDYEHRCAEHEHESHRPSDCRHHRRSSDWDTRPTACPCVQRRYSRVGNALRLP